MRTFSSLSSLFSPLGVIGGGAASPRSSLPFILFSLLPSALLFPLALLLLLLALLSFFADSIA